MKFKSTKTKLKEKEFKKKEAFLSIKMPILATLLSVLMAGIFTFSDTFLDQYISKEDDIKTKPLGDIRANTLIASSHDSESKPEDEPVDITQETAPLKIEKGQEWILQATNGFSDVDLKSKYLNQLEKIKILIDSSIDNLESEDNLSHSVMHDWLLTEVRKLNDINLEITEGKAVTYNYDFLIDEPSIRANTYANDFANAKLAEDRVESSSFLFGIDSMRSYLIDNEISHDQPPVWYWLLLGFALLCLFVLLFSFAMYGLHVVFKFYSMLGVHYFNLNYELDEGVA